MKTYTSFSTRATPQSEPIPDSSQTRNNAGGYAWQIDDWAQLDRFLILGTEGGTYYVKERDLTADNAQAVMRCIKTDGRRAVDRIVEISLSGRAPKNDPALFALAMAAGVGGKDTRDRAMLALRDVARTGTHLFHFLIYVQQFRGWGRILRAGVSGWYLDMTPDRLAYQVIKYRQRDGWSHTDALRKAHPKPTTDAQSALFRWITRGVISEDLPDLVFAFERAQHETDTAVIADLIREHNLPREAIPTRFLNSRDVWAALLERMPLTAMLRNLGKMTSIGLLAPMSAEAGHVVQALSNAEALARSRIHPLSVLVALRTYAGGRGIRGSLTWEPVREIVDALDAAFYLAFGNVTPSNKRTLLALDVSGSMDWDEIAGMPGITPRVASAAMALVTAATESRYHIVAFSRTMIPVSISPRQRLDDVIRVVDSVPYGGTDCAQPILYALERGLEVDTFVVYTDNETWAGSIHPAEALVKYREQTGIPARLVVVGMTANGFSIADPRDGGMLDVVGFDTATPDLIADFSRGE